MSNASLKAPARILVVDDDPGLVRLLKKHLDRAGYETATAGSGTEAAKWLLNHPADLLLLDLNLPDYSKEDLLHHLQSAKTVPFIVITGQGDERVAVEMMKKGAIDYLVKDRNFLELVPAVVSRALKQIDNASRLIEAEKGRQRLEHEILEIAEKEQQRFGHDLHDGLTQYLAGIEIMSSVLEQDLEQEGNPAAARVQKLTGHIRQAIAQTRVLARGLSPVPMEADGLSSALKELAGNTSDLFKVKCIFQEEQQVSPSDYAAAKHLYRIAQEATNNAIRHGKATSIKISLEPEKGSGMARLRIESDGSSFSRKAGSSRGMGLRIMNHRAELIGGTLEIKPGPSSGTVVDCRFPIQKS
jgi:signal transduction histidine kinase